MTTTLNPNLPGMEVSEFDRQEARRELAYRRLLAVVLRLDVAALAAELTAKRLSRELVRVAVPIAA